MGKLLGHIQKEFDRKMKLQYRLLLVPFVAFFLNMVTVAILGTILDINELKELLGGTNTLPIFLMWAGILLVYNLIRHFVRRD